MTNMWKRAPTVRPNAELIKTDVNPIHNGQNEDEAEKVKEAEMEHEQWKAVADKKQDLETKVTEQFEDEAGQRRDGPPITKAPVKPTKEE